MLKFGQHIMVDKNLIDEVCDLAELNSGDIVFEIGAGPGNLTREIAKRCKKVIAIEIDGEFRDELKSMPDNVEIKFGNVLDFEIKADKVMGNLPYDVLEPIFRKLLDSEFKSAVFTVSRKFVDKLKSESEIGVFCSTFLDIERVFAIPRSSFDPPPETDSVIILIKKIPKNIISETLSQNDKIVKNALREAIIRVRSVTKNQAREIINKMNIDDLLEKNVSELRASEIKTLKKLV